MAPVPSAVAATHQHAARWNIVKGHPVKRLLILALALLLASSATAQAGTIGIYADPEGTVSQVAVTPFVSGFLYVVADDFEDAFNAYEFSVQGLQAAGATVLGTTLFGPGPVNIGTFPDYVVGSGGCLNPGRAVLATINYIFLAQCAPDTYVCLDGTSWSSFADGSPGYNVCPEDRLVPFRLVDGGCLVFNPTTPPPSVAEIALDDVYGLFDDLVTMPVSVTLAPALRGDASRLAGIDLELAWDPTYASLENVRLAGATSDWLVQFNAQSGSADIAAAGTNSVSIPAGSDEIILLLDFRTTTTEGYAPVQITSSRLFDLDQAPITHQTVDGAIYVNCDKGNPVQDGEINSADAIRTLLIAMNLVSPDMIEFCRADVNEDGMVDVSDAVLVLQAAVGLIDPTPPRLESATPGLYLRAGDAPGEVLMYYSEATGLDVVFEFDPTQVAFVSSSKDRDDAIVVANDETEGRLRIGMASANAGHGVVRLQFDVADPGTSMAVKFASTFDASASRHVVELPDVDFVFGATGVDGTPSIGRNVEFLGARPNPFNPRTSIDFRLAAPGDATVSFYDVAGRLVRTIAANGLDAGENAIAWNGADDQGQRVASGVYHVVVLSGGDVARGRVVLLK